MEIKNQQLNKTDFLISRQKILSDWPTGAQIDLNEVATYQKRIPPVKNFAVRLNSALESEEILIQPRAGVALVNEQIELLKYLEEDGKPDLLPTTVDSYTRQNRYPEAENAIIESQFAGRSLLNGFPIVNHGVNECRRLNESLNLPIQVRHGTPDARLLAEISIAGGFTAFEGGGISYNIPYSKNASLETTIGFWQYVDRLFGWYEEQGISLNRELFGPLTGTLVPPCISHAISIIEMLLAAEQGVKNISIGYGQCGNLVQDVAALTVLPQLATRYLEQYKYQVKISTVFHQWMGGFPADEAQALSVIAWGTVAAVLGKATKIIVKTPHEALGVPTKEANVQGLKATRQMLNMLRNQNIPIGSDLVDEMAVICLETESILNKVIELGEGDWAKGTIRAFGTGILDVPFAPSRFNRGQVIPIRDQNGAVRLLEKGNLPLPREIQDYHDGQIAKRAKSEHCDIDFRMVINDINAVSKGML